MSLKSSEKPIGCVSTLLKMPSPSVSCRDVTTSNSVVVRVTPPPKARIIIVVVEPGAAADAVSVTVVEHDGLQLVGVKALAVTPIGSGVVMLKLTVEVAIPAVRVADAVSTPPAPPPTIVSVVGVAARLKSNAGQSTTRLKVVVRVTPPPAA